MERRLQTIAFRKEMGKTIKQSRQFIVHRHIAVNEKIVTAPSYLVPLALENNIQFAGKSSLTDVAHPERLIPEKKEGSPKKEKKVQRRDGRDFKKRGFKKMQRRPRQ